MATITSLGIGSGLDINHIVDQLVALERRPLTQMRSDASRLQTQVSAYGKMQSLVSGLQDASNKLSSSTLWSKTVSTVSDESVIGVRAGTGAAPGSLQVAVTKLARSQTISSLDNFADSNALVGAGTLNIAIGAWDTGNTSFTPKTGSTAVDIAITATDTLAQVRDKINGAGAGVSASIVTDASGSRLALRSASSGAENGFRINTLDVDGDNVDGAGLSRLAHNPPAGTRMQLAQAGVNAEATVNGIAVSSASNELGGVVAGLTITLRKEGASAEVGVAVDREAVGTAVKSFADAYSELAKYISEQTKYDAASNTGGPLQGDSSAIGLLSRLRGVLNLPSGAAAAFPRMSDAGLQLQRDGTLKVDDGKLTTAMADLSELRKAFSNTDTNAPANDGFARRYSQLAQQVLGADGNLTTRTEGLQKLISRNGDNQTKLEDRVTRFRERLVAQYTTMDANLSKLNALQSYVSQTVAALNKSSSA